MAETSKKLGPNVRKLICYKTSLDRRFLLEVGKDGIEFLSNPKTIIDRVKRATAWVNEAIALVKAAPDNPYEDDEAIAGEILRQIKERK